MQSTRLVLQEPVKLSSILDISDAPVGVYSAMTKIIGTLGPKSRNVDVLEALIRAGMTVARFDSSWGSTEYHQATLDNLRKATKATKHLCGVMLDTAGPELQIVNKTEAPIALELDAVVTLTPDQTKEASAKLLPINYEGLASVVKPGKTIFIGQYLFTGSETTSVWLEVTETKGKDVICRAKNTATLAGGLFTALVAEVRLDLPTLTNGDKKMIETFGKQNGIDFLCLSYTRHPDDVREARAFISQFNELQMTQIFAKIENSEGLKHFDEILKEADGIVLSRGNLGVDLPSEKVFLFQKAAIHKCNVVGKPCIVTRVVDTMTETPRPTRAEATDVANAVLDGMAEASNLLPRIGLGRLIDEVVKHTGERGCDAILLGAETHRGLYPIQSVSTVRRICTEAEKVYNQKVLFKRIVKYVGEPMEHMESIASSAVRSAIKVKASVIIVFTSTGQAARLIAKYRPPMPVMVVVIPQLTANVMRFSFSGEFNQPQNSSNSQEAILSKKIMLARQCLAVRGLFPLLADPQIHASNAANELTLRMAIDHGKVNGIIKEHDRMVVCQKVGETAVVKIIDLDTLKLEES